MPHLTPSYDIEMENRLVEKLDETFIKWQIKRKRKCPQR